MALLEGWLGGAPALVWAGCDALTEHCRRSGGGLWYDDYPGFEAALDRLMSDPDLRGTMAERGRSYVSAHYTWPAVIHRYRALLERVAGARALEGA